MLSEDRIEYMEQHGREVTMAKVGDVDLGPLKLLPGVWKNTDKFNGRGWNLIALPFADGPFNYRLLMNQYNEELHFSIVDKGVPNRGIAGSRGNATQTDQRVVTLDYDQKITQLISADSPATDGPHGEAVIHREPGLWLYMTNENTDGIDIARLGSVPHGDSLLALGTAEQHDGPPKIGDINGLPIGVSLALKEDGSFASPYLDPYQHFVTNPFKGVVTAPGFPGFNPVGTTDLLKGAAVGGKVRRTTVLHVDSTLDHAGVTNIPFVVRQANAASMVSTFWICEMEEEDENGDPKLVMQYSQSILLDFFSRRPGDGNPGLIQWPHVSINTLEKVSGAKGDNPKQEMTTAP